MHRLILASASPRRKFLLEKAGYFFSISPSHISEIPNENMSIDLQISDIALRKARASFDILTSSTSSSQPFVVLAVDTEVVIDQKLIGKPQDRSDAVRILSLLSGRVHEVKSAVVVLESKTQKTLSQIETSQVEFKKLSLEEINAYLDLEEYQDKAGAYAMQGEGRHLIASFDGNWDNIVGLPIAVFRNLVKELGVTLESPLIRIQQELQEKLTSPRIPKIIAVSKLQSIEKMKNLMNFGQVDFGENYVQEAQNKIATFATESICWHFIGRIQKNKIKFLIQNFDWIHTLSDTATAQLMNQKLAAIDKSQKVLIQVNLAHESTKAGFTKDDLLREWPELLKNTYLDFRGLMTMPPLARSTENSAESNRSYFAELKFLLETLQKKSSPEIAKKLTELSMGTSHDYLIAAQEGATMIRLGTVIFGERKLE